MEATLSREILDLEAARKRLRREHAEGASGLHVTRALSAAMDAAVAALWRRLAGSKGTALVAIGEYGRREIGPRSEAELLVLHRPLRSVSGESPGQLGIGDAAEAVSSELWAAGLDVTFLIRSPDEALELARDRVETLTSFLDARMLGGDSSIFDGWHDALLEESRSSPDAFLERLRQEVIHRHLKGEDASAGLEPDLTNGKGALTDVAAIRWIQAICGAPSMPATREQLEAAADWLHRVRNELHYLTERNIDVLQMQDQEAVGEELVGAPVTGVAPEVDLMRSLYRSCRTISFTLESLLNPDTPGAELASAFNEMFAESRPGKWPEGALDAFLKILSAGEEGRAAFREIEHAGALIRAIPEWERIACLPQRNVYHRFAVDVHTFEVIA